MKPSRQNGWAIYANSPEGHGLIGCFWTFAGPAQPPTPNFLRAYRTAVFETRKEARDALPSVKRSFPKAKVTRVQITVEANNLAKEVDRT